MPLGGCHVGIGIAPPKPFGSHTLARPSAIVFESSRMSRAVSCACVSASSRLGARATRRRVRVARAPARAVATRDDPSAARAPSSSSAPSSAASPRSARRLPVVDLSESDAACASVIRDALFDGAGFFHVRNHGVPKPLLDAVVDAGTRFFDQPLAAKLELARGDMRLSRGYEISPEHLEAILPDDVLSPDDEAASPEPSAARRLVGERFSVGPFDRARDDDYHAGEEGALFFAPNAWPDPARHPNLRPAMETCYGAMETLARRLHRLVALAAGADADFFVSRCDEHCSNLQVANYPSLLPEAWSDRAPPPRKKAHADSGTLTILARAAATEGTRGGLQILDGVDDEWVDAPCLPGGDADGPGGVALLVNVGNQLQRWSDDRWRSTKHRVTNPPLDLDAPSARRLSVAFFHKANYDAVIDPAGLFPDEAPSGRNPPVRSGDVSRVGLLRKFAGMDARAASMAYHEALMGAEAAAAADAVVAEARGESGNRGAAAARNGNEGLGLDRGDSEEGAGAGNANPQEACPVCRGTGWKPCGQCDGTGVNQEDLYGGRFKKGDPCWLCDGKKRTMCGNCVDLTDAF